MKSFWKSFALMAFPFLAAGFMSGCVGNRLSDASHEDIVGYSFQERSLDPEMIFAKPRAPRSLRMFSGSARTRLIWEDIREGVLWSELVIIMADPTDPTSADVSRALVEDTLTEFPWTRLSLVELDRSDQAVTDSYVTRQIARDKFLSEAGITGSPVEAYWEMARAPMVDVARDVEARVLAPNLPTSIATVVENHGLEGLKELEEPQSDYWAKPKTAAIPKDAVALENADKTPEHYRNDVVFSTMADSIVSALDKSENPRTVHVMEMNRDHANHLLSEVAARRSNTRVVTVAVVKSKAETLRDEHARLGDVIIYTNE